MANTSNGVADMSASFLTEAQRAALDAALAAKEKASERMKSVRPDAKSVRKHGAVHVKPVHGTTGDRKNKGLRSGETKKKGAGGKYTWGAMLSESTAAPTVLDKNDPNYDSEEDAIVQEIDVTSDEHEDNGGDDYGCAEDEYYVDDPLHRTNSRIVLAVNALKGEIMTMLKEYLESGDTEEAAACIGDLKLPQYDYYIVKRAITLAMDRKDRERESISCLLSDMYGQCISPQQMQKGFVAVLEDFNELILDVPDAVSIMALFACRAITDEILPPSFVTRITPPAGSPLEEMRNKCITHLSQPHSAEKLLRCWGSEAKLSFLEARERIKSMLKEYANSNDIHEVERQLSALNAPFLHHEVVKQAILLATDDMKHCKEPMVTLLSKLSTSAAISSLQVYKGFQRFVDQLNDLCLDSPSLHDEFHSFYEACIACGVIDPADQTALQEAEQQQKRRSCDGESGGITAVHARGVAAFKADMLKGVAEYFDSGDAEEVARIVGESQEQGMLHIFVKHLIQLAMERSFRERELTSVLLVRLVPDTVPLDSLSTGMTRLLVSSDDIVLDTPDAARMLSLFLARLIVDQVLPPVFLTNILDALKADTLGVVIVRNAGRILSSPHAGERVAQCWHGGLSTIEQLNSSVGMLLKEYLANGDLAEAERSLHELNVKFYHHYFTKRALEAVFEQPTNVDRIVKLLGHLSFSGEVSQTQLNAGFKRVLNNIEDYKLDCPSAATILEDVTARGKSEKWLELEE